MFFSSIVVASVLQLLFAAIPIGCLAYLRRECRLLKIIPILFGALWLDEFLLNLFRGTHFFGGYWNWTGKVLQILWPLAVVFLFQWMSSKEVGYVLPKKNSGWVWGAVLGLVLGVVSVTADVLFNGGLSDAPMKETFLFQLTMPGLGEEPVYRGVLLALCNRYFVRNWTVFNARIGWGVLLTTLLFAAVHIVEYSPATKDISWSFSPFILLSGFLFGWVREKTGSLWPAILAHNLGNTVLSVGRWVFLG